MNNAVNLKINHCAKSLKFSSYEFIPLFLIITDISWFFQKKSYLINGQNEETVCGFCHGKFKYVLRNILSTSWNPVWQNVDQN